MLTPNIPEALQITGKTEALDAARLLASYTRIYLKGGHHEKTPGKDYLLHNRKIYPLNPKNKQPAFPKHGSGCVLASALAANIAKGYPLLKACLRSKRYTEKILTSNTSLLGYHKR
jgi:hydroxymethylpyrimidine/phosphomethylpyrimidine kinase